MAAPLAKSKDELLARRVKVSEMYLLSSSYLEIARTIGCSINTVALDMRWARENWRTRAADAIEAQKNRELAKIDQVEVEAWKGWQRTIGYYDTVTTKTTSIKVAGGGPEDAGTVEVPGVEETTKREKLAGDPRFLQIITDCIRKRAEILGLDSPKLLSTASGPVYLQFAGISIPPWAPNPLGPKP